LSAAAIDDRKESRAVLAAASQPGHLQDRCCVQGGTELAGELQLAWCSSLECGSH
jgi:hypothetical protein